MNCLLKIHRHKAFYTMAMLLILLVGTFFRFSGLDWDDGQHLHPDERFLTMVAVDIKPVDNLAAYFDTANSTLNPHNADHTFYVYGTFPLFLLRYTAELLGQTDYHQIHLVGRALSAAFDLGVLVLIYLLGSCLFGKPAGLLAMTFSSLAVMQIQLSHFFIVDTFGNFFVLLAAYLATLAAKTAEKKALSKHFYGYITAGGVAVGAAAACKINLAAAALLILGAVALLLVCLPRTEGQFLRFMVALFFSAASAVLIFRLLQPYAFTGPSFWNLNINEAWLQNIQYLQNTATPDSGFPPSLQWANRPPWFSLANMIQWGLGPMLGLPAWAGFLLAGPVLLKRKAYIPLLPWVFGMAFFIWQSLQWNSTMRYQLPFYPFLILYGAWFIVFLLGSCPITSSDRPCKTSTAFRPRMLALSLGCVMLFGALAWATAFTSIYRRPHTRVEASRWIYDNIPPGSIIGLESPWDDALPLPIDGLYGYGHLYEGVYLNVYHPDNPAKETSFNEVLEQVDYIILSSNRQWGSITRLPETFPFTSEFYRFLLGCPIPKNTIDCYITASPGIYSGELGFTLIRVFRSDPAFGPFSINDQRAEEAFTVYDHPAVMIFKKETAN